MSRRVRAWWPGLAVAVLFALPLLPEILGSRRLVFRDTQITHWPWHQEASAELAAGRVPFVNAAASGGQPLLANPNAVLLYPTFLLTRVMTADAAFNLHYLIHVLWAFFGARALSRGIGLGAGGSLVAGIAFAFSGMFLSYDSAFMNSSAAAAWMPWCGAAFLDVSRAASARERVRAAAAAGIALGLQLLAGEPAISLLTLLLGAALFVAGAAAAPRGERARRLASAVLASVGAGLLALALAAPLLLPLRAVFALTYRGQHSYSERASGAAAFTAARTLEWILPRFGGNPDQIDSGVHWLRPHAAEDFVYIWCVTFGVVPLLLVVLAAARRDFWERRSGVLAFGAVVGILLAFGFRLPFYRLVYAVGLLRRFRYPIKFYLLTTLAVALLAGLAAETLGRRRMGRREGTILAVFLGAFAAAWALAAPGGLLDLRIAPLAGQVSSDPPATIEALRGLVRGDALLGALATLAVALVLRRGEHPRDPSWAVAGLALVSALPWGLPLFVSAPVEALDKPPALVHRLEGPGRLFVSHQLPRFDPAELRRAGSDALPRMSRVARTLVEQLVPLTGSPFGASYLFEDDPDGSYGYFNRLASEAADASPPVERDRLLILYGTRWALAEDGEEHPLLRPVTGLRIAGRRLVLFEAPRAVPELRWAGRAWRRPSLSDALALVQSDRFDPFADVSLPGRPDLRSEDPAAPPSMARLEIESVAPDRASAVVDADADGHVVFARTYFAAWRARLDGRDATVTVANARDLAVAVPAGRHRIEFSWDETPFRRGVAGQAAAFVVAAAVAWKTRASAR